MIYGQIPYTQNIVILEINTDMTFDKGLNLIKQICWHQEKTKVALRYFLILLFIFVTGYGGK